MIDPFRKIATAKAILKAFGGKREYLLAVKALQNQIYEVA
jgi:hypothetical protein